MNLRSAGKWKAAIAVLVLGLLVAPAGVEAKKKPRAKSAAELARPTSHYITTWSQTLVKYDLEDSRKMNLHIRELVFRHVEQYINRQEAASVSPVEVRREVERLFDGVRWPVNVIVKTFLKPWKQERLLGVGYSLGWSEQNRYNALAIYSLEEGKMREVSVLEFVPGPDLQPFGFVPTQNPDEWLLLVHGFRKGKSHPRLSAALFAFDGKQFRSVWEKRHVYDGKIKVENGNLVISFYQEEELIREALYRRLPPRYRAVYRRQDSTYVLDTETIIDSP